MWELWDGRIYVGQTIDIKNRLNQYKKTSKGYEQKNRSNTYFENALKQYGIDAFKIYIIDVAHDMDELNYKEIMWIKIYNSNVRGTGFNIEPGGKNGKKSEETRKKLSEAAKKRYTSEEEHKKSSEAAKKRYTSEEERKKTSECQKGKKRKPHSDETKKKMSESRKGKKRKPASDEIKNKISESMKERWAEKKAAYKHIK